MRSWWWKKKYFEPWTLSQHLNQWTFSSSHCVITKIEKLKQQNLTWYSSRHWDIRGSGASMVGSSKGVSCWTSWGWLPSSHILSSWQVRVLGHSSSKGNTAIIGLQCPELIQRQPLTSLSPNLQITITVRPRQKALSTWFTAGSAPRSIQRAGKELSLVWVSVVPERPGRTHLQWPAGSKTAGGTCTPLIFHWPKQLLRGKWVKIEDHSDPTQTNRNWKEASKFPGKIDNNLEGQRGKKLKTHGAGYKSRPSNVPRVDLETLGRHVQSSVTPEKDVLGSLWPEWAVYAGLGKSDEVWGRKAQA